MIRSFPPIVGPRPRILVLGTMPSPDSLAARQYYAHRQNQFWALLGLSRSLPYALRKKRLTARAIAVWDVLASCRRKGSADSDIVAERPNPIPGFLRRRKSLRTILFNGQPARDFYLKHFGEPPLPWRTLPSSSPRNAKRLSIKRRAWRAALRRR